MDINLDTPRREEDFKKELVGLKFLDGAFASFCAEDNTTTHSCNDESNLCWGTPRSVGFSTLREAQIESRRNYRLIQILHDDANGGPNFLPKAIDVEWREFHRKWLCHFPFTRSNPFSDMSYLFFYCIVFVFIC